MSAIAFVLGRIFSQSESILKEKRAIYANFLEDCPTPNGLYVNWSEEIESERNAKLDKSTAHVRLYCSPAVARAVEVYFDGYAKWDDEVTESSPPLEPSFKEATRAYNDVILEMRRDIMSWSAFAYRGPSRVPPPSSVEATQS